MSDRSINESVKSMTNNGVSMLYYEKYGNYSSENFIHLPARDKEYEKSVWVYGDTMIKIENETGNRAVSYINIPLNNAKETYDSKADKEAQQKIKNSI